MSIKEPRLEPVSPLTERLRAYTAAPENLLNGRCTLNVKLPSETPDAFLSFSVREDVDTT